jgi:hypothetical protein
MNTNLKAIIIDPITRTVDYCDVERDSEGSTYAGLVDLIFKHREQPGYLEHVSLGAGHGIYIHDEGVLCDWDTQGFFCLRHGDSVTDPFAGVAILVRDTPDGDTADCTLPLQLLRESVQWLHPKEVRVPAPFMQTFDDQGKEEKTLLDGVEEWTYDCQPNRAQL